ncbi:MAG: aminopeptidase N, partial [Planctomycetes bacterium]|nr:aminopeptidase N [Planctomycetota bacterium]
NWTGNRVTCRDWFQLTLKEGLTVFRDQQFSADMHAAQAASADRAASARAVKRIEDVRLLRTVQFAEDAGPMAHPVRPDSYIEINNFYTLTVYEKGAEVVRMYHTLLGAAGFRRGMDLYFARHDGQAVTCDDFLQAMADANQRDLEQLGTWYRQAGTPRLKVRGEYDAERRTYTLHLVQSCPATPGLANDQPFLIPVSVGLLGRDRELELRLPGETSGPTTRVLELREAAQSFTFVDLDEPPLPSLLRGFSAPVILEHDYTPAQLARLMAEDSDAFCRFDASQRLMLDTMLSRIAKHGEGASPALAPEVLEAFGRTLARRSDDLALAAELLALPTEAYVGDQLQQIDVEAVHTVRREVRRQLAEGLRDALWAAYRECRTGVPYRLDPVDVGRRSLQGVCLGYLMALDDAEVHAACRQQLADADNMTETLHALASLCHNRAPGHDEALQRFYERWKDDPLVVDKWLSIQASSPHESTLETVRNLLEHPAFSRTNPNKIRALLGAFAGNRIRFHAADGAGYAFLADQILMLNRTNPMVAARLLGPFNPWRRYDPRRQALMRGQLERIAADPGLSRDVYEIATKALG